MAEPVPTRFSTDLVPLGVRNPEAIDLPVTQISINDNAVLVTKWMLTQTEIDEIVKNRHIYVLFKKGETIPVHQITSSVQVEVEGKLRFL